jgi:sec-independent protein translocase protein TatC
VFGYVVVLERAVEFLLNFNDEQFNIQVRAREYYTFVVLTLMAMGLVFQVPLAILAITRLGIMSPAQLRANRRYAYLAIAVLAALLPTVDPITMLLEMVPLIVLFELSIVLAAVLGRPPGEPAPSEPRAEGSP